MSRRVWLVVPLLAGCGPLDRPLPVVLPAGQQQQVDAVWDGGLQPPGKHDRQTWLDVVAAGRLYQHGVDKLDLRSEKRWAGGTVVMEVHFDRADPAGDHFSLTVRDPAGKVLRSERYDRAEVEDAVKLLFETIPDPVAGEPAAVTARRAAQQERHKRAAVLLEPAGVKVGE